MDIYKIFIQDYLSSLTYGFLLFSIVSLWAKQTIKLWGILLLSSIICGLIAGRIQYISLLWIFSLFAVFYYLSKQIDSNLKKYMAYGVGIALCIALALHVLPGFNNWQILMDYQFSTISRPYNLYLNFDYALIGLILLGFWKPLISKKEEIWQILKTIGPISLIALVVLSGMALLAGKIRFEPKFPSLFFLWAVNNLFFVCIAEEAFFRGFLQRNLNKLIGGKLSLFVVSFLFGVAHIKGGIVWAVLAFIASFFYGYAYQKTKRIEASILLHFFINSSRLLLFTYPTLQGV